MINSAKRDESHHAVPDRCRGFLPFMDMDKVATFGLHQLPAA